jgi:hypothetical protein
MTCSGWPTLHIHCPKRAELKFKLLKYFLMQLNVCYQILIFKLEYDLQIKGIDTTDPVPVAPDHPCIKPVSNYARKVFTFADDCNIACRRDAETIRLLKNVLTDFANISGLECNLEKTNIMCIGSGTGNNIDLEATGFSVKNSLKILGMEISNDNIRDKMVNANFITKKINDNVAKWSRFNLSLPGRILIAKTMLYSQLNYLGSFLDFDTGSYALWETAIHNFVSGNLRISRKRTFLPVPYEGLGLFSISDFLDSQKCRWMVSAHCEINARWKLHLNTCTIKTPFRFCNQTKVQLDPVLIGLITAFEKLKCKYATMGNNYRKVPLLEENLFTTGLRSKNTLKLMNVPNNLRSNLSKLTVKDISDFETGTPISNDTLSGRLGFPVPQDLYRLIVKVCDVARVKFHLNTAERGIKLDTFIGSWKKGSRKFRNIINHINVKERSVPHNTQTFAENVETVINLECALQLNKCWNVNFYSNELRTFIFKMNNNTLPVNTVLSHFVRGASRNCTFCIVSDNPEPNDETIFHLFFDCGIAERTRNNFFRWLLNDNNFNLSRHEFFCCGSANFIGVFTTVTWLFKFYLWECKKRQILPVLENVKQFIFQEINLMTKINSQFRSRIETSLIDFSLGRVQLNF